MHHLFRLILAYPRTVIVILLLPTVFFAIGLPSIKKEDDVTNMLPEDHPKVLATRQIEEEFGVEDSLLVGIIEKGPEGIYEIETLRFLSLLTNRLKDMKGVETGSVKGIYTIDNIEGTDVGFEVMPLLADVPESEKDIELLRNRVLENPLLSGELVSRDGKGTLVYADIEPDADNAEIYHDILDFIVDHNDPEKREVFLAGHPVIGGTIGIYVNQDMARMFPLVGVVVIVMLALLLRSIRGVLLPLAVVLFSVVWTMGAMAYLGIPIYPMTTIVPIIIMALGCADGIHVLARYFEAVHESRHRERHRIVLETMDEMWIPVVMTSLTTTVGFLSLLSSDIEPLRYLGIFSAFGILAAMIISLGFLPACLILMKLPPMDKKRILNPQPLSQDNSGSPRGVLQSLGRGVFTYRRAVLIITLLLVMPAIAGIYSIEVDSDPMRYFEPDTEIPTANRMINQYFNGTGMLNVLLDSGRDDALKEPEFLRKVEVIEQKLEGMAVVGGCLTITDYLKRMNRAMHADDDAWAIIPNSTEEIAQYLLLYSMSGDTEELNRVADYDFRRANMILRFKTLSTTGTGKIIEDTRRFVQESFSSEEVGLVIGGRAMLLHLLVDIIVHGQVYSILLSISGVLIITTLMFRSLSIGVLNILPITVATIWNFGFMSLVGLPLEPASAITSCIGIGVGIDYSIHFISKYRYLSRQAAMSGLSDDERSIDREAITIRTMETAGKAIFFNALVVIFGFLVLLFSNFPPTRSMGYLISLNMFTCFLGALTLLPAAINLIRLKTIQV